MKRPLIASPPWTPEDESTLRAAATAGELSTRPRKA